MALAHEHSSEVMLLQNSEMYLGADGLLAFNGDVVNGATSLAYAKYLKARETYVGVKGWKVDGPEQDLYDHRQSTLYCLKMAGLDTGEANRFVMGMRLTRVGAFEKSLSYDMMRKNPFMQQTARSRFSKTTFEGEEIWDLTRLVPQLDGSVSKLEIIKSIPEIFGLGLSVTGTDKASWVFLTEPDFLDWLRASGIGCEELTRGLVTPGDEEESVLCRVRPRGAFDNMAELEGYREKRTYQAIARAAGISTQDKAGLSAE